MPPPSVKLSPAPTCGLSPRIKDMSISKPSSACTAPARLHRRTYCSIILRGLISEFGIVPTKASNALRREPVPTPKHPRWGQQPLRRRLAGSRRPPQRMYRRVRQSHLPSCQTRPTQPAATRRSPRHRPDHGQRFSRQPVTTSGIQNGRQLAAWAGLVPGQYSSGGKANWESPWGMPYLRSLLVAVPDPYCRTATKQDRFSRWARSPVERRGYWKAAVAIAAKPGVVGRRSVHYGEDFRPPQNKRTAAQASERDHRPVSLAAPKTSEAPAALM